MPRQHTKICIWSTHWLVTVAARSLSSDSVFCHAVYNYRVSFCSPVLLFWVVKLPMLQARSFSDSFWIELSQALGSNCGTVLCFHCPQLSNESADSAEHNSLGGGSTAASDLSWEQVEEHDAPLTRWVPDHAVTHCGSCELKFGIVWRKHHCRFVCLCWTIPE